MDGDRRARLHELDSCLELLESAQERGVRALSDELCERLAPYVPTLLPGMLVTDAIEVIFTAQELCMGTPDAGKEQGGHRRPYPRASSA